MRHLLTILTFPLMAALPLQTSCDLSRAQAAPPGETSMTTDHDKSTSASGDTTAAADPGLKPVPTTDEQWREVLSPDEYRVLRGHGTEMAYTGDLHDHEGHGVYHCAACGQILFLSDDKYDSGSGWPSYTQPVSETNVDTESDRSLGMLRTEVTCSRCGSHLGHVFDDGPQPTGQRYCINSVALDFEPAED